MYVRPLFQFVTFCISLLLAAELSGSAFAQDILFDFDNAPLYTNLPIYQTAGGITAHLSATGSGYSIQPANALGFTPPGFAGHIVYPNSVYGADLLVHFDHVLTAFSIMCCTQELACDDAATVRVTAFINGTQVGFSDRMAVCPCTWPVDTLMFTYPQGFDSVVVHYQHTPPTCQDYGIVMLFDNMRVTQIPAGINPESQNAAQFTLMQNYPNPFNPTTTISYSLTAKSFVTLKIYDVEGKEVASLVNGIEEPGYKSVSFDGSYLASGVYYYRIEAGRYAETKKMILLK